MSILNVEFWAFVGVVAGIYTIFGAGIQVQLGFAGILNFGHVAFMAIGAYVMAILVVKEDMSLWLAGSIAVLFTGFSGLLLGLPALRLRGDFFAIVTVAFSVMVSYILVNQPELTGGSIGSGALGGEGEVSLFDGQWIAFRNEVQHLLGGAHSALDSKDVAMLVIMWAIAITLLTGLYFLLRSPWGRVIKAMRDDEDGVRALGKNVFVYKLQALMLGSALAGIAGVLYALQFAYFTPLDFEPLLTFYAYAIVIMGGTGRIWSVPLGALLFTTLYAGTRFLEFFPFSYLDSTERAYVRQMIIGALLIGFILFRPQGIVGRRQEAVLE